MTTTPETVAARLDAAGGRCECVGGCGKPHRKAKDGRCHILHSRRYPLVLAPPDPTTPWVAAACLTPGELCVWCSTCLAATERIIRRARADARAAEQGGLFDTGHAA